MRITEVSMSDLALIEASKSGDYAKADALIKSGAYVNQQDEIGWTPLNYAAGKGSLPLVKLLVENGADIFKSGRDMKTPYMIALARGSVPVAKYLQELEDRYPGGKPPRPERKYCRAFRIGDLRRYAAWTESRINWNGDKENRNGDGDLPLADDKIVFIHQDFTVTESIWQGEKVIFDSVGPAWLEFCTTTLKFKPPDDIALVYANEAHA
jgi:hypothetical protein